ncbi:MAG: NERD domain-containing protein [Gammaproteobacteria bacterium]|nr:NERD domain-containing protein [Gammaproteobacteria bacterium]
MTFKARLKGAAGEKSLAKLLAQHALAAMHDVILTNSRGGLTQIDHLLLTARGIEVIETKHYAGSIRGRANDKTWSQRLGRKTFSFQNPLHQNHGHVQAVKALLGETVPVNNVVVFGAAARFTHAQPSNVYSPIQYVRTLRQSKSSTQVPYAWLQAWEKLHAECRQDRQARQQHRQQIGERHGRREKRQQIGSMFVLAGLSLALWFWLS